MTHITSCVLYFFFNDTATTEIYTLSLHDALPILSKRSSPGAVRASWDATNRKRALGSIKRRTSHALAIRSTCTPLRVTHVRPWTGRAGRAADVRERRAGLLRSRARVSAASAARRPGAPK